MRSLLGTLVRHDGINFILTNWIPRRLVTRFIGWFSRIEQPLIRDLSIATWRFFSPFDLSDARETSFRSMHACFTRQLREGARPIDYDPAVLVSPCDGIVGTCGAIERGQLLQVKGSAYGLLELVRDPDLVSRIENGCYVTLRLTAGMYHRFHAPHDCRICSVTYISGDMWNVNPPALRRVDRLYCRNERAVIRARFIREEYEVTLVPVGAILVAGIKLNFLRHDPFRHADRTLRSDAAFRRGDEMGWFEHGSTILVLAPDGFTLCDDVLEGTTIRMGMPLMRLPLS